MVSSSILLYLDYYIYEGKRSPQLIMLSILGISMRVTSGIAALVVMTLLSTLLLRDPKKVFHLFKIQWVVSGFCLILVLGLYPGSNKYERELERNEYPIMGGALIPLSEMHSRYDSTRYEALSVHFLVTDTAKINLSFIKKVVDFSKYEHIGIYNAFLHSMSTLIPLFNDFRAIIITFYILLFVVAWNSPVKRNVLFFNIGCWLVILILAMKVTMQTHFFIPWVSMIFGGSLFLSTHTHGKFKRWQKYSSLILMSIMTIFVLNSLSAFSKEERESNVGGHAYMRNLSLISKNKVPLMWNHYPQFPNEILGRNEMSALKNCIELSLYTIQFYKFGQDRCIKNLGFSPLDWKGMNISLHKNCDKIVFITEDSSTYFLKSYYRDVYNMDFTLVRDSPVNKLGRDLYSFHLQQEQNNQK
jgi:hypothetical protein